MDLTQYMQKQNNMTQAEWENDFEQQIKEIIVLRHEGGGGSKRNGFWDASAYFLAYVDTQTGILYKENGRLSWAVSDEERKKGGCFGRFADETIYRVKIRTQIDKTVPEGIVNPPKNKFLVTEIVEKDARYLALEELLAEYQKPIVLQDNILGVLTLNKRFGCFQGSVLWGGKIISLMLNVDKDNKGSWTRARKAMQKMLDEQANWDYDMRTFAANKLTSLAVDWRESADEPTPEITEQSFANRIILKSISMTSGGSFSAFFNDDDMFFGHCVSVYGSLKKGIKSADMEG